MKQLLIPRSQLYVAMQKSGFAYVASASLQAWLLAESESALSDWADFAQSWNDMPIDTYMADGGRYRRRRYATMSAANATSPIVLEPHQPHYQSLNYNQLNGGVAREFEPIQAAIMHGNTMQSILSLARQMFSQMMPEAKWHIECHQFRIEAMQDAVGKPTPEGVHRDGVDFVFVMMVRRENISSGTTTMHDLEQQGLLDSFTLTAPLDCAIVNDKRCMHGVTPIEPIEIDKPAYRDVLVLTFRNIR